MSTVIRKCLLADIFSYENYRSSKDTTEKLKVYISSTSHPLKTQLLYGSKNQNNLQPTGLVTCHDHQSIDWITKLAGQSTKMAWTLLLNGFAHENIKTLFVLLNPQLSMTRSVTINMNWCKRLWSLQVRAHIISVTGVYYSVLGGAFCSLGKNNSRYAYKAGALAIEQIKLARKLKDTVLECKCWLYYAEDLIQLGKLNKAKTIIMHQEAFIKKNNDPTLFSMLEAVIQKMDIAKSKLN